MTPDALQAGERGEGRSRLALSLTPSLAPEGLPPACAPAQPSPADGPLLARLEQLALACWRIFRLNGYARVDFRIDAAGAPWILEVNANPCLSPDAGFSAALERAAIPFTEAVRRIVADSDIGA